LGIRGAIGGEPWVEIVAGLGEGAQVLGGTTGVIRDGTPIRLPVLPAAGPASASAVLVPAVAIPVAASAVR